MGKSHLHRLPCHYLLYTSLLQLEIMKLFHDIGVGPTVPTKRGRPTFDPLDPRRSCKWCGASLSEPGMLYHEACLVVRERAAKDRRVYLLAQAKAYSKIYLHNK